MQRTRILAVWLSCLALLGTALQRARTRGHPLECNPQALRKATDEAYAFCPNAAMPGVPLPTSWAFVLNQRLDLNQLSEGDLAQVKGIGPKLAGQLVRERSQRGGKFRSWSEVDGLPGIGPTKLRALQDHLDLGR